MDLDSFDIVQHFQVNIPLFLRKVDRSGHWGNAQEILSNVFPVDDDGTISLWRVESISDLVAIAMAINANRVAANRTGGSLSEPLLMVAIREEEFGNIELVQSPGLTDCGHARSRHYGAVIAQTADLDGLVNRLLGAQRSPKKLAKGFLKSAQERATGNGCHALVVQSEHCTCEG
jgi:hypothetical protein